MSKLPVLRLASAAAFVATATAGSCAFAQAIASRHPHQGFTSRVQVGGGGSVTGPAGYGSLGGVGILSGGWELDWGGSVRAEAGYRDQSVRTPREQGLDGDRRTGLRQGDLFLGVGARHTMLPEAPVRPWVEAFADYHYTFLSWDHAAGGNTAPASAHGFGVAAAVGAAIDLSPTWSAELGLRFDYVFDSAAWRGANAASASTGAPPTHDGTLWLLLGLSYNP